MKSFYEGKRILVTGGVGSIGSHIVKELLQYNPKVIRVFDNNETGLFSLDQELKSPNIRYLIGDIRDKCRLEAAVEDIDIIFHAAALKHVPLCEKNPFEAIKSNVMGTQNLIDAALHSTVQQFVTISTDKAVSPNNVMGATKLLAERLTISVNLYKGQRKTAFFCVRFGNVLNSRGSVVPHFKQQIQKGYVTITHPEMTRFFISIPDAVKLILKTPSVAQGGEIFILKMKALRIVDLAEVIIEQTAPHSGHKPSNIKREVTGIRPGEKIHEEVMSPHEVDSAFEKEDLIVLVSDYYKKNEHTRYYLDNGFKKIENRCSSADPNVMLSREDICHLLNADQEQPI